MPQPCLQQSGDSTGELSLLPGRPLWYSLVVRSATARVASVELQPLLEYFHNEGPYVLQELLHIAAHLDQQLYSTCIQRQAQAVQSGELELSMFNPDMKSLIKHILDMGSLDMTDLGVAAAQGKGGAGGDADAGSGYAPVVVESAQKVRERGRGCGRAVQHAGVLQGWVFCAFHLGGLEVACSTAGCSALAPALLSHSPPCPLTHCPLASAPPLAHRLAAGAPSGADAGAP